MCSVLTSLRLLVGKIRPTTDLLSKLLHRNRQSLFFFFYLIKPLFRELLIKYFWEVFDLECDSACGDILTYLLCGCRSPSGSGWCQPDLNFMAGLNFYNWWTQTSDLSHSLHLEKFGLNFMARFRFPLGASAVVDSNLCSFLCFPLPWVYEVCWILSCIFTAKGQFTPFFLYLL